MLSFYHVLSMFISHDFVIIAGMQGRKGQGQTQRTAASTAKGAPRIAQMSLELEHLEGFRMLGPLTANG
jgi:hypothetical protein